MREAGTAMARDDAVVRLSSWHVSALGLPPKAVPSIEGPEALCWTPQLDYVQGISRKPLMHLRFS